MKYKLNYKGHITEFKNFSAVYEFFARELGFKDWNSLCGISMMKAMQVKDLVKTYQISGQLFKASVPLDAPPSVPNEDTEGNE